MLATRFGIAAAEYLNEGKFGVMAALKGNDIVPVPLAEATSELKLVPPELYELAMGWQAPKLMTLIRGLDSAPESAGGGRLSSSVTILARRLSRRLAKCGQEARGLELRIGYDDGIADERYTLLPEPTATLEILDRAGLRLLEMSTRRDRRVTDLSLTATGLTAKRGAIDQLNLFRHAAPREVTVHSSPQLRGLKSCHPAS